MDLLIILYMRANLSGLESASAYNPYINCLETILKLIRFIFQLNTFLIFFMVSCSSSANSNEDSVFGSLLEENDFSSLSLEDEAANTEELQVTNSEESSTTAYQMELKPYKEIQVSEYGIFDMDWSDDGKWLVVSDESGDVYAINRQSFQSRLIYSSREYVLAYLGQNENLGLDSIDKILNAGFHIYLSLQFSTLRNTLIVTSDAEERVMEFTIGEWQEIGRYTYAEGFVKTAFGYKHRYDDDLQIGFNNPTSRQLAGSCIIEVGVNDQIDFVAINLAIHEKISDIASDVNFGYHCTLLPNRDNFIVSVSTGLVEIWSLSSGTSELTLSSDCIAGGNSTTNSTVLFSEDAKYLLTSDCRNSSPVLWETDTWSKLLEQPFADSATLSPDGRYLIGGHGSVQFYDLFERRTILVGNEVFHYRSFEDYSSDGYSSFSTPQDGYYHEPNEYALLFRDDDINPTDFSFSHNSQQFAIGWETGKVSLIEIIEN
jgi:hypothetical protein